MAPLMTPTLPSLYLFYSGFSLVDSYPNLHSFPTRRSSDLKITWLPVLGPLSERHRLIIPDLPGHGASDKPRAEYTPRFRSEEHTSELQSLTNLVCRLLLEKKKERSRPFCVKCSASWHTAAS